MTRPSVNFRKKKSLLAVLSAALLVVVVGIWVDESSDRETSFLGGGPDGGPVKLGWAPASGEFPVEVLRARPVVNGSLPVVFEGPILIPFWATYCGPCKKEMPILDALSRSRPDGLRVIGVSRDFDLKWARSFQQEFDVTFSSVMDSEAHIVEELSGVLPLSVLPVTLLLDGRDIVAVHIGPFKNNDEILEELSSLAL